MPVDVVADTKRCPACEQEKPVSDFSWRAGKKYRRSRCKPCESRAYASYSLRHPEAAALSQRAKDLRSKFGMTLAEYDALLLAQKGCCAICGSTEPGRGHRYLVVDHDHETGEVRGLLCHLCNRGLGMLGDDLERVEAAAAYLRAHRPPQARGRSGGPPGPSSGSGLTSRC